MALLVVGCCRCAFAVPLLPTHLLRRSNQSQLGDEEIELTVHPQTNLVQCTPLRAFAACPCLKMSSRRQSSADVGIATASTQGIAASCTSAQQMFSAAVLTSEQPREGSVANGMSKRTLNR